jgi:hypothetical protein
MLLLQRFIPLEDANVVTDALFLVLRNALGYPCDVSDFLRRLLVTMLTLVGSATYLFAQLDPGVDDGVGELVGECNF